MKWLGLLCIVIASVEAREVYKWVDGAGVIHFSESVPDGYNARIIVLPDFPLPGQEKAVLQKRQGSRQRMLPEKTKVALYTADWCPYCAKAKAWLKSHGVAFTEYDIEKAQIAARGLKAIGGSGAVPFAVINGRKIEVFSREKYQIALARELKYSVTMD